MTEYGWALMATVLATAFLAGGLLGRRAGDDSRDTRLMVGSGVGFGAVALGLVVL